MDSASQVILILKLALNIAPPALYFVILGLVNSQSRPHLISSKNDWLALICVFFPIVIYPSIILASWGYYLLAIAIIAVIATGLVISLPKPGAGWVIYNASKSCVRNLIIKSLEKNNIDYRLENNKRTIVLPKHNIIIKLAGFALLKNVTITVNQLSDNHRTINLLEDELSNRLECIESGYNIIGPAMLVAGTSMLILPLMMMVRHIDAFVRVVSELLPV